MILYAEQRKVYMNLDTVIQNQTNLPRTQMHTMLVLYLDCTTSDLLTLLIKSVKTPI